MRRLIGALIALYMINLYSWGVDMQYTKRPGEVGTLYQVSCRKGAFPHPARSRGYSYNGIYYPFKGHYDDSSAAIFVPTNFNPRQAYRLLFYFHGWKTTVERSLDDFSLPQQVAESGDNLILIHPELAKNAADGFGGNFEEPAYFKAFLAEIIEFLVEERIIAELMPASIVLAGHSGAYRVISIILAKGEVAHLVQEVYIFDGLYGGNRYFLNWLERYKGRLVNIVTEKGGTLNNSLQLAALIRESNLPLKTIKGNSLDLQSLSFRGNLFIYTTLGHEEVIFPSLKHLLGGGE